MGATPQDLPAAGIARTHRFALPTRSCANAGNGFAGRAWKGWPMNRRREPAPDSDAQVEALITGTLGSAPPQATHWSTRTMAEAIGMSQSEVSRVWRAFSLQ